MEDGRIVELYWERSETAIKETQIKYGRLFKYVAINILSNNEDADECVNDTYLAAWNAMPTARPVYLSAFLCKITRNLALKKCEYNTAKKRNPEVLLSFSELEECIASNFPTEIENHQIAMLINKFLRNMSYENRNIFIRRYWFYDPISEISKRFQMSESKVASILFRTRNKLRQYLEDEGVDL